MSDIQKFRKAVNGFNRHDVVTYIEYLNNKHRSEITQLENRLQAATRPADHSVLEAENAALKQELEALKTQLAIQNLQPTAPAAQAGPSCTEQELEAYRRAERAERMAIERARATRDQAKAILAEATAKIQLSSSQLEEAAKNMAIQLEAYKVTVVSAGNILNDTAAALGAVCPEE